MAKQNITGEPSKEGLWAKIRSLSKKYGAHTVPSKKIKIKSTPADKRKK